MCIILVQESVLKVLLVGNWAIKGVAYVRPIDLENNTSYAIMINVQTLELGSSYIYTYDFKWWRN